MLVFGAQIGVVATSERVHKTHVFKWGKTHKKEIRVFWNETRVIYTHSGIAGE